MEEKKELPADFWTAPIDIDPLAQDPEVGADLSEITKHQTELGGIVEQMWQDMMNECVLLEGMELPDREELENPFVGVPTTEIVEKGKELSTDEENK
jgi:hypothetical protein